MIIEADVVFKTTQSGISKVVPVKDTAERVKLIISNEIAFIYPNTIQYLSKIRSLL